MRLAWTRKRSSHELPLYADNLLSGIDHLYAIKTISEVHKAGGRITSFLSYCGGLPAPECSDNALG
jgi:saccharopine dehydrogenase (NADP+, L-glutamate forming)